LEKGRVTKQYIQLKLISAWVYNPYRDCKEALNVILFLKPLEILHATLFLIHLHYKNLRENKF